MLLSTRTKIKMNKNYSNIAGHMCYSASKLWNICNYERNHYKELGLEEYPDWYYQKKNHKKDLWYKNLPSQTAQEVCKLLDKSWKSFYALKESRGIENPRPPKYKKESIVITYMQNGIRHEAGSDTVRLSLPKQLMEYMSDAYGIKEDYLFLKNQIFKNLDNIKQIKIYPPENGTCDIIVIYEVCDVPALPDNGRYLSIDLGVHNFMTCYNSTNGNTFIVGRKYLSLCRYYNKKICHVQSQWYAIQSKKGIKHLKTSKHIEALYRKRNNTITDYLHKITNHVVSYCVENNINTVVIGDITNIRKDKDFGNVANQNFHALPYKKIYSMLTYKLSLKGILFVRQTEAYSSQTSPLCDKVSKTTAEPQKRVKRGLYVDGLNQWNADCVGAFNILRLYFAKQKIKIDLNPLRIKPPYIAKVAV